MLCTKRCPYLPGLGVLKSIHLFQYSFYELQFYVKRHESYCDGGYRDIGFKALMIVSILCYIAILKHGLPSVLYNDVKMNICISMT